jgi:hypothetical protein
MPQSLYPSVMVVREFHVVLDLRSEVEDFINAYNSLDNKFLDESRLTFSFR